MIVIALCLRNIHVVSYGVISKSLANFPLDRLSILCCQNLVTNAVEQGYEKLSYDVFVTRNH